MNTGGARYTLHRLRHALLRRRLRAEIEQRFQRMLSTLDRDAFGTALRPFWQPCPGAAPAKYLDLDVWLREAILRYLLCDGGSRSPTRVVDLGSGTGYFLWCCRDGGDEVLGIDVFDEPLYEAAFSVLDLPRREHRIEAGQPLCDLGAPAGLITAFMACFDQFPGGTRWDQAAWTFFLDDVRSRLQQNGRFVVKFNADPASGELYPPDVARAFTTHAGFRSRAFFDYVFFDAV